MKRYVLGFAFDGQGRVLLIRKNRPEWQAGRFNGIGGKQEDAEFWSRAAMVREFKEETGLDIAADRWVMTGHMMHVGDDIRDESWYVSVYATTLRDEDGEPKSTTDEYVQWWLLSDLRDREVIENVSFLVNLCSLPRDHTGKVPQFSLRY